MASSKISNVERLPFATCSRQTSGRINQRLELDCGSRSTISTFLSCSFAMVAAIFTAQAVLPTPPLKLINARTFALIGVDYEYNALKTCFESSPFFRKQGLCPSVCLVFCPLAPRFPFVLVIVLVLVLDFGDVEWRSIRVLEYCALSAIAPRLAGSGA